MKIEVGDYIVFKSPTRHTKTRQERRQVRNVDEWGRPLVGYAGWSNFIVRLDEIIRVEKKP